MEKYYGEYKNDVITKKDSINHIAEILDKHGIERNYGWEISICMPLYSYDYCKVCGFGSNAYWVFGMLEDRAIGTAEDCRAEVEKQKYERWEELASDNTGYKLEYFEGIYTVYAPDGRRICEFICDTKIMEAVEKQKAKKPEHLGNSEDGKILCPNCQEDLWDLKECGFNACPYCGQAIDWSREESQPES